MPLARAAAMLRRPRRTLRMQLALLYAGVFAALTVALLAVSGLLVGSASTSKPGSPAGPSAGVQQGIGGHHIAAGPAAAAAVAALLALALGWLIAGRLLRPLRTITATARDISASNLNRRLNLSARGDEFAELGETLDGLFGRLEASFESQRHFVANASHELRTPLAAERTLLQVALADPDTSAAKLRAACQQVLALGEQQERLIGALLTLASSERGVERWEPFDLAALAAQAVEDRREQAGRLGIRIDATLAQAPASGDPSLAESLLANLLDNAIRHNLDGGLVEIATAAADGQAVVSVGNTGPLISPGEVDRLFQPFQRLGAERIRQAGGHGLGLAIVRAIAGGHGAALTATARAAGGLDIEVRFPARAGA